ncbi:prenyltransferase/squalene oxidase repeat-containing protein [Streptomyces polyrhachis]|uniref:Prenyltransferase/squalene oxidase repeat-containing protein n=1 Tax=Streptomyces polyrhachis TaxID=1282885 RepID=A0ABW2GCM6_9ACTN
MTGTEGHGDALEDLSADIARVGEIFEGTTRYLRRTFVRGPVHGGWRQFLQEDGPPSPTGTACAIGALVAMGVSPSDPQLVIARDLLFSTVCADGGWSKPRLADQFSLTMVTCLSLLALSRMGVSSEHPVLLGALDWVVAAQNSDGGWGNTHRDGQSDTTATSYAMRALTLDDDARLRFGSVVEAGAGWMDRQTEDGAWGIRSGTAPTVAHTSHGVAALIAAGRPTESLRASREWLLARAGGDPPAAWLEHYYGTPGNGSVRAGGPDADEGAAAAGHWVRMRWTHLPAERTLIALLLLVADPSIDAVRRMARDTLARHHANSYWRVASMPDTAPSWAVLEAVDALARYRRRLRETGQLSWLKRINADLVTEIAELRVDNSALLATVQKLDERLSALESAGSREPGSTPAQRQAPAPVEEPR